MNLKTDLLALLISAIGFAVALATLMSLYLRRRDTRYDEKLHRIELEMFRRSIENEIVELNEKMMATQARWKDANHLLIAAQNSQREGAQRNSLLHSFGIKEAPEDPRLVFVLTPFNDFYAETYEHIVRACMNLGLRAVRGDEEFIRGEIFPKILDHIQRSSIVIANIDGRNPNVFYELGIAHALGKQTILVSKSPSDVPFDIRANRIVFYTEPGELIDRLQIELGRALAVRPNNSFNSIPLRGESEP